MTKGQYNKLVKASSKLEEILENVQEIYDALEVKYENMSDAAQESEKGQRRENAISELYDFINTIEVAIEYIDNSTSEYSEQYED